MQRCQVTKYKSLPYLSRIFRYLNFSGVIIFRTTFYFYSLHFHVIICTFYSLHFPHSLVTRISFRLFSSFINRVNLIVIGWEVSTYIIPTHYWSVRDLSPLMHESQITSHASKFGSSSTLLSLPLRPPALSPDFVPSLRFENVRTKAPARNLLARKTSQLLFIPRHTWKNFSKWLDPKTTHFVCAASSALPSTMS